MLDSAQHISLLWMLLAAALVFFMQVGFALLEVGLVRQQNMLAITVKNLLDWMVACIAFTLLGFALMFGPGLAGLSGNPLFSLTQLSSEQLVFLLFQLTFAATACTILSGAIAGRASHAAYAIAVLVICVLIYPLFGHWVWGAALFADNSPWLAALGFHDFAGSAVVHATGAWCGLVGAWVIGPRIGWLDEHGQPRDFPTPSLVWSFVGVLVLWFGWWGFNGGSAGRFDGEVGRIILLTNLAAACGGVSALLHARLTRRRGDAHVYLLGGVLTGLVAITASADVAGLAAAMVLGLLAGVVHNLALDMIKYRWRIDDPVGAVAVHGAGGTLGILAVPFVAVEGVFADRLYQFGVQSLGALVCFFWAAGLAWLVFVLVKKYVGLRVSPQEELAGISLDFKPAPDDPDDPSMDEQALAKLLGELS